MNSDLRRLLALHDGVITWAEACRVTTESVVRWALRTGDLARPFRGVLVDPTQPDATARAALRCTGGASALSHTSALAVWQQTPVESGPVHIMTSRERRIRVRGIVAHRRAGFAIEPPWTVVRNDLPVTSLEHALGSWPLLGADDRRGPLIRAVSQRRTTPARVHAVLAATPTLRHRGDLRELLALLAAGCHSHLELWGYQHVFTGPGFERLRWQVRVRLGGRSFYLDAYDEDSATNFELDGAASHDGALDRERDRRRDATLGQHGILSVRYGHKRLHSDIAEVRREALATMAIRSGLGRRVTIMGH